MMDVSEFSILALRSYVAATISSLGEIAELRATFSGLVDAGASATLFFVLAFIFFAV